MSLSEDKIIVKFFAPLSEGVEAACGLEDDCALLSPSPDGSRVITSDMLIAGVHFFPSDAAGDIAWKALGVNVSDLIASGGRPEYYLLSIALDDAVDEDWLAGFSEGLREAQSRFGLRLIGGDTTRSSGPLTISITAMGSVAKTDHKLRAGASDGDLVFVTGTIGDSALGCALRRDDNSDLTGDLARDLEKSLSDNDREFLIDRYLRPQPRIEMLDVVREFATASMDVSDGLMLDFDRLAHASQIGGNMAVDDVPLSMAAQNAAGGQSDILARLLTGGDDYELLLTVSAQRKKSFLNAVKSFEYPVHQIGTCTDKSGGVKWLRASGEQFCVNRRGFDHFDL